MRSEQEVNRAMERHADTVRRLCLIHLKNHADTEDIFQNVFLKYALSSIRFESEEHERAWFIRVTLNACRDLLKSFFRSRTVPLEALEPKKAAPEQALRVTDSDGDWYVESDHPARKDDYISFLALVTGEKLLVLRQYPEWEIHARLPGRPHGRLVWYSTTQGLFYQLV